VKEIMKKARKVDQKEKKDEAARSETVDEMLKQLEEEEFHGTACQEDVFTKMQENPLATLGIGAVVGAGLVYFFTRKKGQQEPPDQDMT
jgi:hypothetical protein